LSQGNQGELLGSLAQAAGLLPDVIEDFIGEIDPNPLSEADAGEAFLSS
jgi:hypothetical protein